MQNARQGNAVAVSWQRRVQAPNHLIVTDSKYGPVILALACFFLVLVGCKTISPIQGMVSDGYTRTPGPTLRTHGFDLRYKVLPRNHDYDS